MRGISAIGKILLGGGTFLGIVGAVDMAATVGEVVGERAGILPKGTKLIATAADKALSLAGWPDKRAPAPAGSPIGDVVPASVPALPAARPARNVCPDCNNGAPVLAGATGETITFARCPQHVTELTALGEHTAAMYRGWSEAYGVDLGKIPDCGPEPVQNDFKNAFGEPHRDNYERALIKWQACAMKRTAEQAKADAAATAKAAKAAAKEAADDAKAAAKAQKDKDAAIAKEKKAAEWKLQVQAGHYRREKEKAEKEKAAAATEAERVAAQKKLDEMIAAKAATDALLADITAKAKDADHQKQIDALQAQILAAKGPSGTDTMIQMLLAQQAQQQQAQPVYQQPQYVQAQPVYQQQVASPVYQQQFMPVQDSSMFAAPPQAIPWAEAQMPGGGEMFDDGSAGMYFSGASDPMDQDVASALGIEGAQTQADGRILYEMGNVGYDDEELALLATMLNDDGGQGPILSGCAVGACSVAG